MNFNEKELQIIAFTLVDLKIFLETIMAEPSVKQAEFKEVKNNLKICNSALDKIKSEMIAKNIEFDNSLTKYTMNDF